MSTSKTAKLHFLLKNGKSKKYFSPITAFSVDKPHKHPIIFFWCHITNTQLFFIYLFLSTERSRLDNFLEKTESKPGFFRLTKYYSAQSCFKVLHQQKSVSCKSIVIRQWPFLVSTLICSRGQWSADTATETERCTSVRLTGCLIMSWWGLAGNNPISPLLQAQSCCSNSAYVECDALRGGTLCPKKDPSHSNYSYSNSLFVHSAPQKQHLKLNSSE